MSQEIATYLKYANVQMAAEATTLDSVLTGAVPLEDALFRGNERASRFTRITADAFVSDGWKLVAHQKNTPTGFSGSLFQNSKTGEFVMSFRSTEFADDAVRDNQETNALEIREEGWAFGQIDDMQQWYRSSFTCWRRFRRCGRRASEKDERATGLLLPADSPA